MVAGAVDGGAIPTLRIGSLSRTGLTGSDGDRVLIGIVDSHS